MSNCYICNVELTEENNSCEHILLNAIGGKLKSYDLLCKECNSNFGEKSDSILAERLSTFSSYLNVKRDRSKNKNIEGFLKKTGEKYLISPEGEQKLIKPIITEKIENGKKIINVVTNSKEEQRKILTSLKKKYSQIDIEKVQRESIRRVHHNNEYAININYGGEDIYPAVCKIAVNFYLYKKQNRNNIEHLIHSLKKNNVPECVYLYNVIENPYKLNNDEIHHTIYLEGNKKEGLLFAYIDFFNVKSFIVILNNGYEGENFHEFYIYDLINNKELSKKEFSFDYDKIRNLNKEITLNEIEIIKNKIARFDNIVNFLKRKDYFSKIMEETHEKLEKEVIDGKITREEYVVKIANKAAIEMVNLFHIKDNYIQEFPCE